MMKKTICFSIVSHGQSDLVELLLSDIDKFVCVNNYNLKIIVTENVCSKRWKPSVKNFDCSKITNIRKKGFGSNHNAAFEKIESDFFFIINPDVRIVAPIFLDRLIDQMEDLVIYSPKVVNNQGLLEDFERKKLSLTNLIRRRLGIEERGEICWFAGIVHAYTSQTFKNLKGFDPRYFMYVEDTDICYRLHRLGGKLEVFDFTVVHNAQRQTLKSTLHTKWHVKSLCIFLFLRFLDYFN